MSMIPDTDAWGITLGHVENAECLVMVGGDEAGGLWLDIDGQATFFTSTDAGYLLSALGAALRVPATAVNSDTPAA